MAKQVTTAEIQAHAVEFYLARERRIRESLAALHAPQSIELSASCWAKIMAEYDEDEEG